ncbi:MAG TPA: hypothetical protein EYQ83_11475, partial [Acidobacteria bacterium]|nr:hypothetical protein [Acidobacteriota bacterium]
PVGLPHRLQDRWGKAYPAPEPALARRLQEIAWAAAGAGASSRATTRTVTKTAPVFIRVLRLVMVGVDSTLMKLFLLGRFRVNSSRESPANYARRGKELGNRCRTS